MPIISRIYADQDGHLVHRCAHVVLDLGLHKRVRTDRNHLRTQGVMSWLELTCVDVSVIFPFQDLDCSCVCVHVCV